MNCKLTLVVVGLVASLGNVAGTTAAQEYSAGYDVFRITDEDRGRPIQIDLWYPSDDGPEREHDYGLGAGRVVSRGSMAPGPLPVVLLSHGAMGAASNYSWIAEHLARTGFVVLGVSHFGESVAFGPDSVDPAAVSRFGDRTRDLRAALGFLLNRSAYAQQLDRERVGALGHSSGGASVLMLLGADFRVSELAAYCVSAAASRDKGCQYSQEGVGDPARADPVASGHELHAVVVLDPAVGPGFRHSALRSIVQPILVVGSYDNDFLPYAAHAGHVARGIVTADELRLDGGEGHFVYVDQCSAPIDVMGVPLCQDRGTVDRAAVHRRLAEVIERFFKRNLVPDTPG